METLRRAWRAWKALADRVGAAAAKLLLGALYFLAVAPLALAYRAFRNARPPGASAWRSPEPRAPELAEALRQD